MPHVCFVLHPRFQMLAYVFASESLRIANKRAGSELFTWETRSATSGPVTASNDREVVPDLAGWTDTVRPDLVLVMAGYDPLAVRPPGLAAYLHRADRAGAILGGIDTGVVILASFELLHGRTVVLHHEAEPGFREEWPDISVADAIYHIDDARLSSAGGTATGDAMLSWISSCISPEFSTEVARDLVHGSLRPGAQSQRPQETSDPTLHGMRALMLGHLEHPLPIRDIAERLDVSEKQLRSLCRRAFDQTPSGYYLHLRLDHARSLLATTQIPITEIAMATGFASHAGFSRTYRKSLGHRPKDARRIPANRGERIEMRR